MPTLLVHYMPWYEADPARRFWGWHWKMNAFDPERIVNRRREIASHYMPLIGPYDSGDPMVLEYHLLLMKLAGIDGLMVDWYGLSDLYDYPNLHRNTGKLFPLAAQLGLKVALCYEDTTIPRLVAAGKLPADQRVAHARRELDWVAQNWFGHPAYLKRGGKPVLLSFGADGLTDAEWAQVLAPPHDRLVYLSEHRRRPVAAGAFDWPVPQRGLAPVDDFYGAMKAWPVAMPVAFPRFHDIYKEGKAGESYGRIEDAGGKTFRTTLERGLKSGAPLVQIATWNDWGEGTGIEPTEEFQYRDLEAIQRLRPGRGRTPDALRHAFTLWGKRRAGLDSATFRKIAGKLVAGRTREAAADLEKLHGHAQG